MTALVTSGCTICAVAGFLAFVNPAATAMVLVLFGAVYGAAIALNARGLQRLGRLRAEANRARFRVTQEALGGIKDVKVLGHEARFFDRFVVPSRALARYTIWVQLLGEVPRYVLYMLTICGTICVTLILLPPRDSNGAVDWSSSLPVIGLFALAALRMLPELSRLYGSATQIGYGSAAIDRLYEDLSGPAVAFPQGCDRPPLALTSRLDLKGVSYRYPNAARMGLETVSFTVEAGEMIGVVGKTGSGKTTLADTVLGLLEPTDGELIVDGMAITDENRRSWMASVGYVAQDIFLADASVAENIAFGVAPECIDRARLQHAGRIAQIHEFVEKDLPQGYDTRIGERGIRLSGGQRQRIGIARALYRDVSFLLFDEATSALDTVTEAEVMAAVLALKRQMTVMIIAHRLSTLRGCDRIFVMEAGRVVATGSWLDLHRSSAVFQDLVAQSSQTNEERVWARAQSR